MSYADADTPLDIGPTHFRTSLSSLLLFFQPAELVPDLYRCHPCLAPTFPPSGLYPNSEFAPSSITLAQRSAPSLGVPRPHLVHLDQRGTESAGQAGDRVEACPSGEEDQIERVRDEVVYEECRGGRAVLQGFIRLSDVARERRTRSRRSWGEEGRLGGR